MAYATSEGPFAFNLNFGGLMGVPTYATFCSGACSRSLLAPPTMRPLTPARWTVRPTVKTFTATARTTPWHQYGYRLSAFMTLAAARMSGPGEWTGWCNLGPANAARRKYAYTCRPYTLL